ncbi:MAG: DUF3604 domain-containing protein [Spirochaeta sp.]|jgi:hypothetical protein|nr:DUF3604 domain-containing protein [Spirochaeta sp.]
MSDASSFFGDRRVYYGDLHNHCGISYGHGPVEDAYKNAALQLDFASVTGHGAWPDILDQPMPEAVVAYHRDGFARLKAAWDHYLQVTENARVPGTFETFFSYEIHSFRHGDRAVISPDAPATLEPPESPAAFDALLAATDARRDRVLLLPHHIGYAVGYRGVNWASVTDAATPVVEIISMHGLAESDDGTFPYLHTMGPLDGENTMAGGLNHGLHFGVLGSTDHHSAHPGSFGYGRTAVWAPELTREAIWEAILARRTYAVSGDRIELAFSLNGFPMGSVVSSAAPRRSIHVRTVAGGAIDRIEVVKNGVLMSRYDHAAAVAESTSAAATLPPGMIRGKAVIEMGWGQKGEAVDWDVTITPRGAAVLGVEPRLRGQDVVDPLDTTAGPYAFSAWKREGDTVHLTTRTAGNATVTSRQTQAMCLEVSGAPDDAIEVSANGTVYTATLAELLHHSRTFYTHGFVSPAIRFHRLAQEHEYTAERQFDDPHGPDRPEDVYYVRVIQQNGQAAWSSPIWVHSVPSEGGEKEV